LFFRTAFENAPFFSYYAEDDAPNGAKCNPLNRFFYQLLIQMCAQILSLKVQKVADIITHLSITVSFYIFSSLDKTLIGRLVSTQKRMHLSDASLFIYV